LNKNELLNKLTSKCDKHFFRNPLNLFVICPLSSTDRNVIQTSVKDRSFESDKTILQCRNVRVSRHYASLLCNKSTTDKAREWPSLLEWRDFIILY